MCFLVLRFQDTENETSEKQYNCPTGEKTNGPDSKPMFMKKARMTLGMIAEVTASICVLVALLSFIILKCRAMKKRVKEALADPRHVRWNYVLYILLILKF